tara:strand:- start:228 stop:1016 length:789 start_codon:yes stop_codon:yes gene_type:complete
MPQLKQHATVIVENDHRALKSRSATDFVYQLTQPIKFFKRSTNKQYYVRIENVRVPISFYNINSTNNTFSFDEDLTTKTFNLTPGNYTIDDLKDQVEDGMNEEGNNTYLLTYSEITQKINIENDSGGEAVTSFVGTGWKHLGFDGTETLTTVAGDEVDGSTIAYTNTMRHLKLQIPNLVSNNVYSNDSDLQTQVQPVGLVIPITEIRNEFQFYDNHSGPLIKFSNQTMVSDISVKLLDPNNNLVDLNDVPFGFEIVFYEYNK